MIATLLLAGMGLLLAWIPRVTRPDLYFAVTVRTGFSVTEEARSILQRYRIEVALHTAVAIAILLAISGKWGMLAAVGWQLAGATWASARARTTTMAHRAAARPQREAAIGQSQPGIPGGWPVLAGPLVFLAGAAAYAWLRWDELPGRIPVHWGLSGADRWVDRTPAHVFGFLGVMGAVSLGALILAAATAHASRTIYPGGEPGRRERKFKQTSICLLLGVAYLTAIVPVLMALGGIAGGTAAWALPLAATTGILVTVVLLARSGQGGSQAVDPGNFEPPVGDRTPDEAWKWGVFYFNPKDPAMVVEKRMGLGYTLNFGNPWSWLVMAILMIPLAASWLMR